MSSHAIIVAAGRGSRMGRHTDIRPKCLVEFAGRPLIEWQIDALRHSGVDQVTIVTGYRSEMLEPYGDRRIRNADWADTNMVYSLMCAKNALLDAESTIIAYSDLVYEPRILTALSHTDTDVATVVDDNWRMLWAARFDNPLDDAETLKRNSDGTLREIGQKPSSYDEIEGQFVGLTRLTRSGGRRFVDIWEKVDSGAAEGFGKRTAANCYFTDILQRLIEQGEPLAAAPTQSGWLEFDNGSDLKLYEDWLETGQLSNFFETGWSAMS